MTPAEMTKAEVTQALRLTTGVTRAPRLTPGVAQAPRPATDAARAPRPATDVDHPLAEAVRTLAEAKRDRVAARKSS